MSRLPRVVVPGVPIHITQRGVDRCPTFLVGEDYAFYRWALRDAQAESHCAVHAYALMTNHVHLLVTPRDAGAPAKLMRSLGRRYVRYFNDRYGRTGTLWEGRFRSTLVDSGPHLFACHRYIELNPVRAGMVADAAAYEWSSFRRNSEGLEDDIIREHALYAALGATNEARCNAYRAMFVVPLAPDVIAALRAAPRGRPTMYSTSYQEAVASLLGHASVEPHADDGSTKRYDFVARNPAPVELVRETPPSAP